MAVDRAKAHRLAVAAEWDRLRAWAADGAGSGRCWLADQAPSPGPSRCRAANRPGGGLRPGDRRRGGRRVAAGGQGRGAGLGRHRPHRRPFVTDQQVLLDGARRLPVDEVAKLARWWQRLADDGADSVEADRRLRITQASDGTIHLRGVLDAETGSQVRTVIDAIASQLWRADGPAPATSGNGHRSAPAPACGPTPPARWPGGPPPPTPTAPAARPLISVVIDLATLEARAGHPSTTAASSAPSCPPPGLRRRDRPRPHRPRQRHHRPRPHHPHRHRRPVAPPPPPRPRLHLARLRPPTPAGAKPTTSSGGNTTAPPTSTTSHIARHTPALRWTAAGLPVPSEELEGQKRGCSSSEEQEGSFAPELMTLRNPSPACGLLVPQRGQLADQRAR